MSTIKTDDELHETAMRAHFMAKGITILLRDGSSDGQGAADILLDDLVRLTDELNTGLDAVNRP